MNETTVLDDERAPRSFKKTHQWCKGVPGRWHMPYRVPYSTSPGGRRYFPGYIEVCDVCGKKLRNVAFFLGKWHKWS